MGNILAIAGLVGTVVFGVLSIIFSKKALNKNKIVHVFLNSYEIGKGLKEEFSKFELKYDGNVIKNNIIALKGGFVNLGRDIKSDDVEFDLILPENCRILDVKIESSDNNLIVFPQCNGNKLHYKINDLLLSEDFFLYSALVESNEEIKNIGNKLSFKHRMHNTKKINNTYINVYQNEMFNKTFAFPVLFILTTSIVIVTIISLINCFTESPFLFKSNDFDIVDISTCFVLFIMSIILFYECINGMKKNRIYRRISCLLNKTQQKRNLLAYFIGI